MSGFGLPASIGITADWMAADADSGFPREPTLFLAERYCRAVEEAGGVALILPCSTSAAARRRLLERLDGLIVSGGDFDIHPSYYGEEPINELGRIKHQRTEFELELVNLALARDLPVLGICGGAQALNVALGGALYQDIATQVPRAADHQQSARKHTGGHRVRIQPGTRLERIVQSDAIETNTTHHQAVKSLGRGLVINAVAEDGVIEGIESQFHTFALGVQWHPEVLAPTSPYHRRIFTSFVASCKRAA
ncbi:MAG TPA: gamma-glutamyl-gamma-aminobutyrate hydrolase family protein [Candidatus Eisenbacteria bacterium]|nr:gamma-glutamyl-gamma-aminobutyrate hydrolase family protein [Candidatus Eisenbacteria bacterium]